MAYQDWEVTAGQTPTAAKWNELGDNDQYLYENRELPGMVKQWAGLNDPATGSWMICDGRAISRATYSSLFAVIGTAYGVGDNSTTFNIPNTKQRTIVGVDSGDAAYNALGKTGGASSFNMSHTHGVYGAGGHNHSGSTGAGIYSWISSNVYTSGTSWTPPGHYHDFSTSSVGDHAHSLTSTGSTTQDIRNKFLTINSIIKVA